MAQDMALEGLLAAARSRLKPADLPALLAGVSAAPEGLDPDAWMALVAPQVGPELKAHLRPLYQAARQEGPGKASIADRLQALRAELARRGLAGFIVPRADEHQGEYVPPRAERLAWITGFGGSAGLAVILAEQGGDLRRWPLHHPGPPAGGREALRLPPPDRGAGGCLDRREPAQGRQAGLRPLAPYPGPDRAAEARRGQGRRRAGGARGQSAGRRLAGPAAGAHRAGPSPRPRLHRQGLGGEAAGHRRAADGHAGRCRGAHRPGLHRLAAQPARRRRAADAAAAQLRHPPCRRPGRSLHRTAQAGAGHRGPPGQCRRRPRARRARRRAGCAGQGQGEGAGRSQQRRRLDLRPAFRRRRRSHPRRRSLRPAQGLQERGGDRGRPRRPSARRRRRHPLPLLAFRRGAEGQAHRARRRREAGGVPPRPTT